MKRSPSYSIASLILPALLLVGLAVGHTAQAATTCTPRTEAEILRGSSLAFIGETAEVTAQGWVRFSNTTPLHGVDLSTPRVFFSAGEDRPKIGQKLLVVAVGDYDNGYAVDPCIIQQANASPKQQDYVATQFFKMRIIGQALQSATGRNFVQLLPLRKAAQYELEQGSAELARRLYSRAVEVSRGEAVDRLGEGRAYLRLGQSKLALSSFDDVLEKDSKNSLAWAGRYQALMQMGRFSELPAKLPDLPNLALFGVTLPASLDFAGRNLSQSWWRGVTAKGAKLSGANLQNSFILESNLNEADLRGANLTGATLRDTSLKDVLWDEKTLWPEGFTPPAAQGPTRAE
jgi:hypothetical protein